MDCTLLNSKRQRVSIDTVIEFCYNTFIIIYSKSQSAQHPKFSLICFIRIFGTYSSSSCLCTILIESITPYTASATLRQNEEMLLLPEIVQAGKLSENGCVSFVVPCSRLPYIHRRPRPYRPLKQVLVCGERASLLISGSKAKDESWVLNQFFFWFERRFPSNACCVSFSHLFSSGQ